MMEEIIEPQVYTAMLRNPQLMKSESLNVERALVLTGTVRASNILKSKLTKKKSQRRESFVKLQDMIALNHTSDK